MKEAKLIFEVDTHLIASLHNFANEMQFQTPQRLLTNCGCSRPLTATR